MEGLVKHGDNQVQLSEKCLEVLDPKQWNNLPPHVKNAKNLYVFKRMSGLILVTCCMRFPHSVPFFRNKIPCSLLKTSKQK